MFSGIIRRLPAAVTAVVFFISAAVLPGHTAAADPDQDQKFFDLLGQKEIPPVDNATSLITSAHKVCGKLDDGVPVGDIVETIRNNGFNENPLTRLDPPDRITRTINQFITASVEAYCPRDRGKIASIAAYTGRGSRDVVIVLASLTEALPRGRNPADEAAAGAGSTAAASSARGAGAGPAATTPAAAACSAGTATTATSRAAAPGSTTAGTATAGRTAAGSRPCS